MSADFPELERAKVSVDEATRTQHLASISKAIRETSPWRARIRLLAVAAATILLVPVMALASERAVPGDFLYPVKQAFEPLLGVFDSDVAAQNRVLEVERLYERDAPSDFINHHLDVARDAVIDSARHVDIADLTDRIERVRHDLAERDLHRDLPSDLGEDGQTDRKDDDNPDSRPTTDDSVPHTEPERPQRDQG